MEKKYYRGTLFIVTLLVILFSGQEAAATSRQKIVTYASSLKGLKQKELKNALFTLMNSEKYVLDYGSGTKCTWWGFWYTDRDEQTNECFNRYSGKKFYFNSNNTGRSLSGMNIEHSFPKSWWGGSSSTAAYMDLYNLYPSDAQANSEKSNYPMAPVDNAEVGEYGVVATGTINGKSQLVWEPGDTYKGEFARSYMYMAVAYADLTWQRRGKETLSNSNDNYPGLLPWAYQTFIKWGKMDRVSDMEKKRNDEVSKIQKNRNLFIDYPFLAEYVWGDSINVEFNPETSITTADDDTRYAAFNPTGDDDINYNYVKVSSITSGKEYLIVAEHNDVLKAMMPFAGGKTYGYLSARNVVDKDGVITLADRQNAFTFTSTADGYTLQQNDGRYLYMTGSYNSFNVDANANDGAYWTVEANADGTFKIMNISKNKSIQYSIDYGSYGSYPNVNGVYPALYELQTGETAIEKLSADKPADVDDNSYYNLQGQRIDKPSCGIYIHGGKKIIIQ